ncbi:MAG TPA: chemotaxis protein CheB, partial [Candidatus Binatia bacterium]
MDDLKEPAQIVAIGASAGGMNALSEFFSTMPGDSGLAFVVIQHLDPNHESHMASLLARVTPMKAVQAEDHARIEANCVYTIPPGKFLAVDDGVLCLSEPIKSDGIRLPIDFFLRSLAHDQHEKAIAVLLSGSGSDGTLGIREVSAAGGIVIAQDPTSAQFDSMIVSAIATGRVDSVLPVREMAGALLEYVRRLPTVFGETESEATREYLGSIVDLMARRTQNDFRHYKNATLQRRMARRMGLRSITRVADYYRLLEENPEELEKLSKDMLISVTSFFRDADAFTELGDRVINPLVHENPADRPLRLWCAGCATGEEVYSLAILIMEAMALGQKKFPVQIFASDI